MSNQTAIILGDYQWDVTSPMLINSLDDKNNPQKKFTKKQFLLMRSLYNASPDSVSNQDIIHDVWGEELVSVDSLPQLIIRTRQTLGDKSKAIIVNLPGEGYALHYTTVAKTDEKKEHKPLIVSNKTSNSTICTMLMGLLLTGINLYYLYDAYYQKTILNQVFFSQPYPKMKPMGNHGDLLITIDDAECKYERKHHTIDCK